MKFRKNNIYLYSKVFYILFLLLFSWTVLFDYETERKDKITQSFSLKTTNETLNETYSNEINIGRLSFSPQTAFDIKLNWFEIILLVYIISILLEEGSQVSSYAEIYFKIKYVCLFQVISKLQEILELVFEICIEEYPRQKIFNF